MWCQRQLNYKQIKRTSSYKRVTTQRKAFSSGGYCWWQMLMAGWSDAEVTDQQGGYTPSHLTLFCFKLCALDVRNMAEIGGTWFVHTTDIVSKQCFLSAFIRTVFWLQIIGRYWPKPSTTAKGTCCAYWWFQRCNKQFCVASQLSYIESSPAAVWPLQTEARHPLQREVWRTQGEPV